MEDPNRSPAAVIAPHRPGRRGQGIPPRQRGSVRPVMPSRMHNGLLSGHHGAVQTQEQRDHKTVAIGAAIGIFALLVVLGATGLWLADLVGVSGSLVRALQLPLFAVAGLATVVYLARALSANEAPRRQNLGEGL